MFSTTLTSHVSKAAQYDELLAQARSLMSDETNRIANRKFSPFCSPMDDGKYLPVLMILSGERSFLSSICSH
jgi:hypothetical protein